MGFLSHKCIRNYPEVGNTSHHWGELTDESWYAFMNNKTNWYKKDEAKNYLLCGNMSGAGECPDGYTCLEGMRGWIGRYIDR